MSINGVPNSGKVTIVTGGGGGIGRVTAKILAGSGHSLLITDINGPAADTTAAEICQAGGTAIAWTADLSDEEEVRRMVTATVDHYGRLDAAFNNAAIRRCNKLFTEIDGSEWRRAVAANLDSVFYCMKYEIMAMQKTGGGAIVNTSSGNGVVAIPRAADYVATKHGVIGLTRAASSEADITGVRVNAILPGFTLTPQLTAEFNDPSFVAKRGGDFLARHSVGRFGQPEEIAETVKFLLSDGAAFINGAAIPIDGGYTAR